MMSNNNNLTENNNEKSLNRAKWMLVSPTMSNKMKWFWDHFKHYNLEFHKEEVWTQTVCCKICHAECCNTIYPKIPKRYKWEVKYGKKKSTGKLKSHLRRQQ